MANPYHELTSRYVQVRWTLEKFNVTTKQSLMVHIPYKSYKPWNIQKKIGKKGNIKKTQM